VTMEYGLIDIVVLLVILIALNSIERRASRR
jgi:hypothetical protein